MIKVRIFLVFCISLLLALPYTNTLRSKTFRCDNGNYVYDFAFCNGIDECRDGTDESGSSGCDWSRCDFGEYVCRASGICMNSSVRCNTKKDCSDGSDEKFCGDEINVNNCSLADGKFLCHDGLRCLDFEYTCDGSCHCFDCSDENSNCSKIDHNKLRDCPHSYFPSPNGPICLCDPKNNISTKLCQEFKNCSNEQICQQRCSRYKDKVQCSCFDDYVEVAGTNGFKCRSKAYYQNSMIYSTSSQIKFVNLTNSEAFVIKSDVECVTLAAAHDDVYYVTYYDEGKSIFKTSISSKKTEQVLKSDSAITSIAVDYITNNIYFTTNNSLSVCSNDGKICAQLKCSNITYVALAPKFGFMFYTTKSHFQDERFIVKSNMDGSNEYLLIDGTFRYPVPLAVEESTEKLYWLEIVENVIHSVSFNGVANEVQFLKFYGTVASFTALGSTFYYAKSRDNQIYSVDNVERFTKNILNKTLLEFFSMAMVPLSTNDFRIPIEMLTESNATKIIDNNFTLAIRELYAFNSLLQSTNQIENPCKGSPCSGLCLLRSTPSINRLDHTCVCDDFTRTKIQSWCNISSKTDFDFNPQQEAVKSETTTQKSNKFIYIIIVAIVAVGLIGYIVYSAFRRDNCYRFYEMFQNCLQKRNERENIYNGEDL